MIIYILLLLIIAVISYMIGNISTIILASHFVFKRNLLKLGTANSFLSNFFRNYKYVGFAKLFLTEVVKDAIPIVIGLAILSIKGHPREGAAFAGFCLVMGRLYPAIYSLKGSHAIIPMIATGIAISPSAGIAAAVFAVALLLAVKRYSIAAIGSAVVMLLVSILQAEGGTLIWLAVFTAGAVIVKHLFGLGRALAGEEEKISFKEDLSYKFDSSI